MGFFNELAGWAHIANVEAKAFIHGGYGSDLEGKEKIISGNSIWSESTRMWVFDRNKADNVCCSSPSAYAAIMAAVRDKKLDYSQISPDNINIIQKVINNNEYGDEYDEEETLSGIMAVDVISFIESKGIDLSKRNDTFIDIGKFLMECESPVSPELIAENAGVKIKDANMYLGLLEEYAARNKALILGCDITDSCDAAEISEFLRRNNIPADSVDIEEIKKEFPKFTKERINTLLGTIQLIAFVENRGLDLLNTPKLMDIVSYIAKLEPESGLPSSEKIAEDTGASRELVEKYFRILREYVQEHRSR